MIAVGEKNVTNNVAIVDITQQMGATPMELQKLYDIVNNHALWQNPLLKMMEQGELNFTDFQFIFSQYYLYSKNFTRLLAAVMVNCESDYYRSKLSENLWEEGGGIDIEKRHAQIFRTFLHDHLKIKSLDSIEYKDYTYSFANNYLHLVLYGKPLEASAALSLGTEGIVVRLYTLFIKGLLQAGLTSEQLHFFNLHVECDDEHAATLQEMMLSYMNEENWFERCSVAIKRALDLRDEFFKRLYETISIQLPLASLIERVVKQPTTLTVPVTDDLHSTTNLKGNILYKNDDADASIKFKVQRVPFPAEVLDPRVVVIPAGFTNECHSHAHETVFLILSGSGEVQIDFKVISIKAGDLVFVPRWLVHQTRNTGNVPLKFFAVTDYGFTGQFPQNSETVYRLNKMGVSSEVLDKHGI
jgi:mannose-6-phosphate isomerase-like protein (cupin superfamily)/pyrroloquinoline quinone (PQQ) biosynthesis protein C